MRVVNRLSRAIQKEAVDDLHDLVQRAGQGDTSAFRELYERYHDRVYRYAHVRLGHPEEARDVMQEVFLAAWRGLPRFRYEHEGSFPAWLFGIARNVIGTHRRKARATLSLPLEALVDHEVEFEGGAISRRALHVELARLPAGQREVLVLRFLVGLRTREVAAVLGKSEGAVTALQLRGLRRLHGRMVEAR